MWAVVSAIVLTNLLLVAAQTNDIRIAQLLPQGEREGIQFYVNFLDGIQSESDGQFLCKEELDVINATKGPLLDRAFCRVCPDNNNPRQGVLMLPDTDELVAEFDSSKPVFIKLLNGEEEHVEVEVIEDAPELFKLTLITPNSIALKFSAPIVVISEEVLSSSFDANCSRLFPSLGLGDNSKCKMELNSIEENTTIITFLEKDSETLESLEGADITSMAEVFYGENEIFGLKPVTLNVTKLEFLPRLEEAEFLANFSFNLVFDEDMEQRNEDRFLCSDLLTYHAFDISTESYIEIWGERNDLFCALKWINLNTVNLQFTDFVPYLLDGAIGVKQLPREALTSGVPAIRRNDGYGLAVESSSGVIIDEEIYDTIQFKVKHPTELTRCDTKFIVQIDQIAGPPLLVDFIFSVIVTNDEDGSELGYNAVGDCIPEGNILSCNTLSDILNLNSITYSVSITAHPIISVAFQNDVVLDRDLTGKFVQDVVALKIPISVTGINNANPDVSIEKGSSVQLRGELGDAFGCVGNVPTEQIEFTWVISASGREVFRQDNRKTITVQTTNLAVGNHIAKFSASLADKESKTSLEDNSVAFNLTVTAAPTVAVSAVGDSILVSSIKGNVILDASTSCNPNVIPGCSKDFGIGDVGLLGDINDDAALREATGFDDSFTLTWSCDNCGNFTDEQIFEGVDRNRMVVNLTLSEEVLLRKNLDSLSFKFTISKDETDDTSFSVLAKIFQDDESCFLPKISIASVGQTVNIESSLTIFGAVEGFSTNPEDSQIKVISWGLDTTAASISPLLVDINTLQREKLFIPPNTLVEGQNYTFRLSAAPKCADFLNSYKAPFAQLSFTTNKRPTGGKLAVSPETGQAVTETFTLTANNWKDADGDSLEYAFEIAFVSNDLVDNITEIDAQQATQLRSFTPSIKFETTLPLPPPGFTMFLISLARDSLGSVSRRVTSSTRKDIIVTNPFEKNETQVANVDIELIQTLISDLSNTGDKAEIPTLCTAISSALNDLSEEDVSDLEGKVLEAKQICLNSVSDTLDDLEEDEVDVDLINLVANSVKEISGGTDEANQTLLDDIEEKTGQLIDLAKEKVEEAQKSGKDPTAGSLFPDSFRDNIINSISNTLLISDVLIGGSQTTNIAARTGGRPRVRPQRRLQDKTKKCKIVEAARFNIEKLANLQNSFVVAGAPPIDAESSQVRFTAVRESLNEIGSKTASVSVPGGLNDVELPKKFAEKVLVRNNGLVPDTDINVVVTKWDFAIRCEERTHAPLVCDATYEYNAPLQGKEGSIVAVDFFPFEGDTSKSLVIENLTEPISIILDAPKNISNNTELIDSGDECMDEIELKSENDKMKETTVDMGFVQVCGFFDEALGDFSTNDCETTILDDGRINCSCTHATDYAAWIAFKYDVGHTFKDQIILSPLAQKFISTFFPIFFCFGTVLFIWAVRADKRDSKNILKAALARLKLLRVINRRKKLQFFYSYESAKLERVMGDHDKLLRASVMYTTEVEKPKHAGWWIQFYLAIKYEHSVIGIRRYDPNFSRVQRVAVFFAVVISNFGAAALVYELRSDVYQVSIAVTLGVSFLSAFLVSIPVKMMVRLLFKATSNFVGSSHDMVNNMYRVLSRVQKADGVESAEDRALVDAVHAYMNVEREVELASKKLGKYSSSRGTTLSRTNTRRAIEDDGDEESISVIEDAQIVDEADIADPQELLVAKQLFEEAKNKLKIATVSARIYWGEAAPEDNSGVGLVSKPLVRTFYTSWDKIRSSRRQPSGILRFAAVVAEDPSPVGKHRAPWFPSRMVFLNWVALFLVVGFYSFYIVKFIGTRRERAANPDEDLLLAVDPVTESEYLAQWVLGGLGGIVVSYVIAEPLIALIRYVFLPMIISKFGKDLEHFDKEEIKNAKVDPENKDKNIREGYAHNGFDLAADLIESLF